jgi:hypothetical protein
LVFGEDQVIGEIQTGERRSSLLRLTNKTNHSVRVVGSGDSCKTTVCVSAEGLPLEIPACDSESIRVVIVGGSEPGDFREEFSIYTDCPGQAEVVFRVIGRVDRARESPR